MGAFENLRKRWPQGCSRCGDENPSTRGIVSIRLAEAKGNASVGTPVTSKQTRFCESCSVEVYGELLAVLKPAPEGEGEVS